MRSDSPNSPNPLSPLPPRTPALVAATSLRGRGGLDCVHYLSPYNRVGGKGWVPGTSDPGSVDSSDALENVGERAAATAALAHRRVVAPRVGPSVHAEAGVFSELAKRLAGLARAARIRRESARPCGRRRRGQKSKTPELRCRMSQMPSE
eukprot:scaffold4596_cov109-Isochrysis_galbana.AAC.7